MIQSFATEKQSGNIVDPSVNNLPLEFRSPHGGIDGNAVSSSASVESVPSGKQYQERNRNGRERGFASRQESCTRNDQTLDAISVGGQLFTPFAPGAAGATISGMLPTIDPAVQWPLAPFALVSDPGLLSMMGMAGFGQFGFVRPTDGPPLLNSPGVGTPAKEVFRLNTCILYPPKPNAPFPTTRKRPPGCRTVFVGGLPENTTEDAIREIFSRCGEISTIRTSKKNFCHIRYDSEEVVDSAIYLSGYRVRIGDKDDGPNTGRLHVDYAQARDDQYEFECNQRAVQREMRHRERLEQERLRPPSPPPIVRFSEHEASLLAEKLRGEESFPKAAQILITWLDRGESTKKSAGQFYSMIQSTNGHVRRLMNEKAQYEEEMNQAKQLLRQRMQGILIQFDQIEKVFTACSHQKVWDHFTKPQRKNIDMWRKQSEEIKNAQLEEVLKEREEDEMELSDDDMPGEAKKSKNEDAPNQDMTCQMEGGGTCAMTTQQSSELATLKEENDSLRCQLEAYRNEVEVLKVEGQQEKDVLDRQIKILQQALQGTQQQMMELGQQRLRDEDQIQKLRELKGVVPETTAEITSPPATSEITSTSGYRISEKEARLIGLISMFLHVHPFGAGVDYIWSYLHQLDQGLQPRDVETLMLKFPSVFLQELLGVGAMMERRWKFVGFTSPC